ncbi:MAG: class E sortase [Acidimicrobiia bacterium]
MTGPLARRLAGLVVATCLGATIAACGSSPSGDTTSGPTTTTVATPVPAVPAPPAAVPVSLPVPVAPPDPEAPEPYVEIGTIEIPKLGLRLAFAEGITMGTLDRGPGHWPGSAMPGEVGNAVVAGHRVTHTRPFRDIDDLVDGDEVIFETAAGRFTYRMVGSEVVPPTGMYILDQTEARTATLFACHPPGSARYRYVVHLELAS